MASELSGSCCAPEPNMAESPARCIPATSGAVPGRRGLFEDAAQIHQIVLVQLAVNAPRDLVGRNGVLLLPAAAGVRVEIDARIDGTVHGGDVETRRVRQHRFN